MGDAFNRNIGLAVLAVAGILALDRVPWLAAHSPRLASSIERSPVLRRIAGIPDQMHNGDLNPDDFDALAAGYYEGLRKDAGPVGLPAERDDVRFRDDFLRYELRPGVKRPYPAGMRITNSLGMANPEYGYEKPANARRVAVLGDSMSLGPYGRDYPALLERRLNEDSGGEGATFQVLNFAVYGYSVVQMMDVALEKAARFHPDVYMVALTHLEVMPKAGWRTHVGRLVASGTDLKYDFLRQAAAEAGVRQGDHLPTVRMKLAPYFVPVVRQALERIRERAAADGAQTVIVLVPAPINPEFTATDFNRLHSAADGVGVPVLDLRNTFRSAVLDEYRVDGKADIHPNARGHERIFENLYAAMRAEPRAWAAVRGGRTAQTEP